MQTSKLSILKLKPLKVLTFLAIAFPVLLLGFLMSAEFLSDTSAEQINVNIGDGAYTMSIAADNLSVDIDATPSGVQRSVQKDIQVTTNSGTGYKLYLAMDNDNTNGNRLYYNGNTMSTSYIQPTSSATLGTNTWGYSMDGNSWAAVPLKGSEALIGSSATTPAGTVTHSVYYGFNVNNTLPFGQYKGAVTYTLVGDAAATPKAYATVMNAVDDKTIADPSGGNTLVVTTSLMTNMTDIGTASVTIGGTACPIKNVTTKNKYVEVQCTMPAKEVGTYNVAVSIPKFDKTYSTTINYAEKFWMIANMQQMTTDICNSVYTPSNAKGDAVTIVGSYADYHTNVTAAGQPYVAQRILSDVRDDKTYTVRKLADGNCWMTSDLLYRPAEGEKLVSSTTDLQTISAWTTTAQATDYTGIGSENGINWYLAIAGQDVTTNNTAINDSICPKGWRLPSNGSTTKSFKYLQQTTYSVSGYGLEQSPFDVTYEDNLYYRDGAYHTRGRAVQYWTGGTVSNGASYGGGMGSGNLHVWGVKSNYDDFLPKDARNRVRCVNR